jgi:hypothetical protein
MSSVNEVPASPVFGRRTLLRGLAAGVVGATCLGTPAFSRLAITDPVLAWYDATASSVPEGDVVDCRTWALIWLAAARALHGGETDPVWQESALAGAVNRALSTLAPGLHAAAAATWNSFLARVPAGSTRDRGLAAGESSATKLIAERATDRIDPSDLNKPFPLLPPGPGVFQPVSGNAQASSMAGSSSARPFLLDRVSQFRPAPPPAVDSVQYRADLAEVRRDGSATSTARTPEQLDVATFWLASVLSIYKPVLRAAIEGLSGPLAERVRLVALFHVATVDNELATYEAKYAYHRWRPVTAIRADAVDPDPGWTPVHVTPNTPDYPSAHCSYAGAAEGILTALAGPTAAHPFTITSATLPGKPRTYTDWYGLSRDVMNARVWSGYHFRTSDEMGRKLGMDVAAHTVSNASRLLSS